MTTCPNTITRPEPSARRADQPASPQADATPNRWSVAKRTWLCRARFLCVAAAVLSIVVPLPEQVQAGGPRHELQPKILVLRGVFEVFSLGMNDLAQKLRCRGYDAKVTSWSLALLEAKCSDEQPLVIVGHSLGGRMCGWVPRKLRKCGKRVPLIVIVDANLIQRIPDNVDKCVHLYVTNKLGIFHGSPVRGESAGMNIVNLDVSKGQPSFLQGGVNHFNIDATDWVHEMIINEIAATFPASRGAAVIDDRAPGTVLPPPPPEIAPPHEAQPTTAPANGPSNAPPRIVSLDRDGLHAPPTMRATESDSNPLAWRPTRPPSGHLTSQRDLQTAATRTRTGSTTEASLAAGAVPATSWRIRIPPAWRPDPVPGTRRTAGGTDATSLASADASRPQSNSPRIRIPSAWQPTPQTTRQATTEWVAKRPPPLRDQTDSR